MKNTGKFQPEHAAISEKDAAILLLNMGFCPELKGYCYTLDAIMIASSRSDIFVGGITKILYPGIAKKRGTTPQRVEQAIRHAIEKAQDINTPLYSRLIKHVNPGTGKPTNGNFLATVIEVLRLRLMDERVAG